MALLKNIDSKMQVKDTIEAVTITLNDQADKVISSENFKNKFKEGITPEALRESLHKKLVIYWANSHFNCC